MALQKNTTDYYNKNSQALAKKFAEFGGNYDIKGIFDYLGKENPSVLEIGCGDGRDANKILKLTKNYLGFDISKSMVNLAKKNNPQGNFLVANSEKYNFPKNIDVVFALTSLLHSNKTQLKKIFSKVYHSLNDGGIFYISLKYDKYHREIKKDELGSRVFYFYTVKDIANIAGNKFKVLSKDIHIQKGRKFFIIILQKV